MPNSSAPQKSQAASSVLSAMEASMEVGTSERRIAPRLPIKADLRLRAWKLGPTERRAQSLDLSQEGTLLATDAHIPVGSVVEVVLKMPEEITGKPAADWRCTGHVVRLQSLDKLPGQLGFGVQFDYCEILPSKAATQPHAG
jgi:hypothetical protein